MSSIKQQDYMEYTSRYWDKHNGMLMGIISGAVALGTTLVLGSYGYTWLEINGEKEEKRVWRKDLQESLDTRFSEIKKGQSELSEKVNASGEVSKALLMEILAEQKKQRRGRE
jgi:hypothetical protein